MAGTVEKNQVGKREDLLDLIAVADAADKPFFAMVKKGKKIGNMLLQWQADKFDDPKMGGVADGVDADNDEDAAKDRKLIQVYAQQFRRIARVGNIAEEVSDVAGVASEMAQALDKKREEIGRDIEVTLCSDQDTQVETDETHPYLLRGLGSWLQNAAQGVLPVDALYRTPTTSVDATAMASLDEDGEVRPLLKSIYQQHGQGEELTLLCGTDLKEAFTNMTRFQGSSTNTWATIRTYNGGDMDAGKITNNITLYEGDFNKVKLVPSLFLARNTTTGATQAATNRRGYVLPMGQATLRPHTFPKIEQLPYQGGGKRAQIRAILALQYGNPLRGGKFAATA